MMNTPLSSTGQLARYFVAGPLVLAVALGLAGARAQGGGPVMLPMAAAAMATPVVASAPAAKVLGSPSRASQAIPQLPAGIKAYIAKTYPGSTISAYFAADRPSDKVPYVQYYASITDHNGERHKLYFNKDEQPVAAPVRVTQATALPAPGLGQGLAKPIPVVYLDGQRYSGDINDIGPQNIANISVYKGEEARRRFGAEADNGMLVVTTIANQNRADVVAFNEKVAVADAPAVPKASGTPYLAAPALAYITKNYPDARLMEVAEVPSANGGPSNYKAMLAVGRRPISLLFDERGKFISEVSSAR